MLAPLVVLLTVLLAATPSPPGTVLDRIAAVVGDEIVVVSEVDRFAAVGMVARRAGETEAAYRDRILDQLVVDLLRERELRRTGGLDPDPRLVDEQLATLVARVEKEHGRPFQEVLDRVGVTRQEVVGWLRRGAALQTFTRERLAPVVRVSDEELRSYYDGPFRVAAGSASLAPLEDVSDELRTLVREEKLNAEIARWTETLREKTRVLVYRRTRTGSGSGGGSAAALSSSPPLPESR